MPGVATPLWIYGVTALACWLVPTRLSVDGETVLSVYPTKALALVTVSLGIAHASLALHGGMVVRAAGCWAVATLSMVTVFAVSYSVAPSTWSGIIFVQTLAVGASACAFGVLAWQLAWRRVATAPTWWPAAPWPWAS
jgi:hypothetical protein